MSDNEQKFNNIASKAGNLISRGSKKIGKAALSGSSKSLANLPQKMGKVAIWAIIIFLGASFFFIVIFGDYYESGEAGGETGLVDIDHNNKNLSDFTDTSDKKSSSSSSSSGSSSSDVVSGDGDDVSEFALEYVGNPYVWGGTSLTEGCDCSGFTLSVMAHFGVSLPHSASGQRSYGTKIDESELAPGDLVFYDGPDHVAIYIGDGKIVHAANSQLGITTGNYDYRDVAYCARYVSPGTSSHSASGNSITSSQETKYNSVTANYSPANLAFFNFYVDISKNKSVYQIKEENGSDVLISPEDPDAVSDYFHNDDKFYISPFLLYSINNHVWGNTYAYPEAFLNPVAHDSDYNLVNISEDGEVAVKSNIRKRTGEETGKEINSTSDYGLASILKYKEQDMVDEYKGTYVSEDYYDYTLGTVKQKSIDIPYSIEVSREDKYVLEWAQTFAGRVSYEYMDTSVLTEAVQDGKSSDVNSNYKDIYYKSVSVPVYVLVSGSGSSRRVATASSLTSAINYIKNHSGYSLVGSEEDADGNITGATVSTRRVKLYRHRSSDSGRYTNFVEQTSVDSEESSNDYLDDYLSNFATYKPTTISRDPEVFSSFTTIADDYSTGSSSSSSDSSSEGSGSFAACFSDETIGEYIKTIWDTSLAYGHSEEQTAAILGNMWWESDKFNINAVSSDGHNSYGLCQWTGGRKTQLFSFASGYFGEDTSSNTCSFESQVEFAMMELDTDNAYNWCSPQWYTTGTNNGYSHAEMYSTWLTSDNVDDLTTAMCITWERAGIPHIPERQAFAEDALDELSGQSFGMELEVIEPDSGNGNGTGGTGGGSSGGKLSSGSLSAEEKVIYSDFYHEADDIYDSGNYFDYMEYNFTKDQRNDTLLTASALSQGITKDKARLDIGTELWEENYIVNISELSEMSSLASTLDSVSLADQSEFLDYDFLWPFAKDADGGNWVNGTKFSSRFGPRVSPTAGATSNHQGLDIPIPTGTPIYAVSEGTVSYIGDTGGGGYAVYVNHGVNADGQTVESRYFHLKTGSAVVSVGDTVSKGQQVALSNNSGTSTGAHLHLGIAINGLYYNPLAFYDMNSVPMLTSDGGNVENVNFNTTGGLPSDFSNYKEYLYFNNGYSEWN